MTPPDTTVGVPKGADVQETARRFKGNTDRERGGLMPDDSGYGFINGPRDSSGRHVPFSSTGPAIAWMAVTFVIGALVLAAVIFGIWLATSNPAALGFVVPLAMCAIFIVPAAFAACVRTGRELAHKK
jgi:hypothetical protein